MIPMVLVMIVKTKYLVIRDMARVDAVVCEDSNNMVVIFESGRAWKVDYGSSLRDLAHDYQKMVNAIEVLGYGHADSEFAMIDERLIEPERTEEDPVR